MTEQLRLNRDNGKYELTFKISVDAEIFQRDLFAYATQNHIDPTNAEEWQKAIAHVTLADMWLNHPHAVVLTSASQSAAPPKPSPAPEPEKTWNDYPSRAELRQKALNLPVEKWDTLLTPLPDAVTGKDRKKLYQQRHKEHVMLDELKQELHPLNMPKLEAIAAVVNGNGHK